MPYVLRDTDGNIQAMSLTEGQGSDWHFIEASAGEYLDFLHASMSDQAKFRESDLHLARVLEDLIALLIERDLIRFTDFPEAAQKRLIERQSLRNDSNKLNLLDEASSYQL